MINTLTLSEGEDMPVFAFDCKAASNILEDRESAAMKQHLNEELLMSQNKLPQ